MLSLSWLLNVKTLLFFASGRSEYLVWSPWALKT